MKKNILLLGAALCCVIGQVNASVGKLIWEDNFDTLNTDIWTIDTGDGCDQGLCGWGNQELQWYSENNTFIETVPGEAGNKALVLEAKSESSNGYAFTSGKVQTSNKIAVQYGMIEVRVMIPDVGIGLWPAAWMLGTSAQSWPSKGEIDMMEMGQSAQAREDAGFPDADINNYVGSNLLFYTEAACNDGNPTCAASLAWKNDNAHVSDTPLTNRFVTYRTYWTDSQIRFTVEDNGVEIDLYDAPFTIGAESNEFQAPFYFLLNLAVGGNFTDAANNSEVTATTPAKMYVDYVRVYELDGQGEVLIGDQTVPENGPFGIFTDETYTYSKLVAGQDTDIYVWNTNSIEAGTTPAYEGDNVIAWNYTSANEWFGGGIHTRQLRDLSNFSENGKLSFKIKIPADVSFRVGIEDSYTNQNWVEFPANETAYGLVRNGEWATATIPVNDIRGALIALQSTKGLFYIASIDGQLPTGPFEMAIDDIVWTGADNSAVTDSDNDGVDDTFDLCANSESGINVDENGCAVVDSGEIDNTDGAVDDSTDTGNTDGTVDDSTDTGNTDGTVDDSTDTGNTDGTVDDSTDTGNTDGTVDDSTDTGNTDGTIDDSTDTDNTDGTIDDSTDTGNTDGTTDNHTSEKYGLTASSNSVEFFVNVIAWADVHYILNDGVQQNFRMTNNEINNTKTLSNLVSGDVIQYSFTYFDDNGAAKDSVWTTYSF